MKKDNKFRMSPFWIKMLLNPEFKQKTHSNSRKFLFELGIERHYDRMGDVLIFNKRPYENSGRHYELSDILNWAAL